MNMVPNNPRNNVQRCSQRLNNSTNENNYFPNNNKNQYNNISLRNNYMDFSNMNQKKISNNRQNNVNMNKNISGIDKRLNICLNYLGLNKYISNFQNNGINFDDFLSLSNKDFSLLKIPNNIQEIIQDFIISYLNFGSLYTSDEIVQFFRMRKTKKGNANNNVISIINNRGNNKINRGNLTSKHQSVNNLYRNMKRNNDININSNMYNNNIQRRNNNNRNCNSRPKSQSNKPINYDLFNNQYFQNNNYDIINNQYIINSNNKINPNSTNYNNYINNDQKQIRNNNMNRNRNNNMNVNKNNSMDRNNNNMNLNNNMKNIKRKNNFNKNNSYNSNMSLASNANNMNYIPPSIDNLSHIAVKENYLNFDNLIKMAQFRDMNNDYKNLKKNLSNKNRNIYKSNNSNNNQYLNKSTSNNIIQKMDNILKRIHSTKENNSNIMTQSNFNNMRDNSIYTNTNKGYHSDGYLNEQKKLQQFNNIMNSSKNISRSNNSYKNIKHNNNNVYLNGYEINTYYTGDTSQLDSIRGENNINCDFKKIKGKNGRIYYSKENKVKKINEDQTKKIEQLLGYGSPQMFPKTPINNTNKIFNIRGNSFKRNNGIIMKNYDNYNFNNDEEVNSIANNRSKTNLTNYTYGQNNNYVNQFNININNMNKKQYFSKKNSNHSEINRDPYSPTVNRFIKQKNTMIQGKKPQKNISNNISKNNSNNARIFNNFNTYLNNRGNISNIYENNYEDNQGIKINNNIMNLNNNINKIPNNNKNSRAHSNYGPVQIKNGKNINNNYFDVNQNIIKKNNYININNKERKNNFMNNNNNKMSNNNRKNYSVGQNKMNNIKYQIPNNYINAFINVNNNSNEYQRKRNAKSYDGNRNQLNIGVYSGIHNINNNINNININNINYDSMGYSKGFNNLMGLDMGINFRTQKNFYNPNNILNDEAYFDEIL